MIMFADGVPIVPVTGHFDEGSAISCETKPDSGLVYETLPRPNQPRRSRDHFFHCGSGLTTPPVNLPVQMAWSIYTPAAFRAEDF
jgi:hypothetical protein